MRAYLTPAILGAALLAAAPAMAQTTTNAAPGDTYRGVPGQGALDQSTVGLKAAAMVQPPEQSVAKPTAQPLEGLDSTASQTLNPTTAHGAPPVPAQAQTGQRTQASATADVVVPTGWTGTAQQWTDHTAACAKRYKSYDAKTDHYVASRGRTAQCMIGLGK